MVYEALAEGGITRFLAIFQEPLPISLGPVRSLRPYYLDWGLEYGVPVAHAGGSQPALAEVPELGLKDINALEYDGSYFFRTTGRVAPHNLYTNSTLLPELVSKLGFDTAPSFTPLPRKADAPMATPSNPVININFSHLPSMQFNIITIPITIIICAIWAALATSTETRARRLRLKILWSRVCAHHLFHPR